MVISKKNRKDLGKIKQKVKQLHTCSLCNQKFEIGIELEVFNQLNGGEYFPYPHIHLHGNPLHAMLCYLDKENNIRSCTIIKSIEISRDSETFGELMNKWSNPY